MTWPPPVHELPGSRRTLLIRRYCHGVDAAADEARCPSCDQRLTVTAMLLCRREDDGKRVCRIVWRCGAGHRWWIWSDRPGAELVADTFGA